MLNGIITARYTMRATVLHRTSPDGAIPDPGSTGRYVETQDPLTGEIISVWEAIPRDNPSTPGDESFSVLDIPCFVRGIVDGGVRAAASTESFDDVYRNIDIINAWIPKKYRITKGDRMTNIRTKNGSILWRDEELEGVGETKATVFNVNGVTPILDPFNRHIDNFCLLERVEV